MRNRTSDGKFTYGNSASAWERFYKNIEILPNGCWQWKLAPDKAGYGHLTLCKHHTVYAHRFAYEQLVGPIPEGKELHHLCHNRRCVNPAHLEPVTRREHIPLGDVTKIRLAQRAAITHCPRGHPYDSSNTYIDTLGHRQCKTCTIERHRKYRADGRERITCPKCGRPMLCTSKQCRACYFLGKRRLTIENSRISN